MRKEPVGIEDDLKRDIWTFVEERIISALGGVIKRKEGECYEDYERRVVVVADKVLEAVLMEVGGGMRYVPRMPMILRYRRDRRIREGFNGDNLTVVAGQADMSERQVRRICVNRNG